MCYQLEKLFLEYFIPIPRSYVGAWRCEQSRFQSA